MPTITDQPRVLLFAGPSGHGKTELARNLGRMLSLDLHNVDCAGLSHETDLFGPLAPFKGSKDGSVVNNYLASHNGQRCIVFMDEFEKTKDEVRQALLLPFGNGKHLISHSVTELKSDSGLILGNPTGEYRDRRDLRPIDCSKTIWILATNAFDKTIQAFYETNRAVFNGDPTTKISAKSIRELGRKLSKEIMKESMTVLGVSFSQEPSSLPTYLRTADADVCCLPQAPLTGRITDFIPFLPFSRIEQAAVADKYLSNLARILCSHLI